MYNALSVNIASVRANLKFNEELFYINEQLKESGSSIRTYLRTMNKSNDMSIMRQKRIKIKIVKCMMLILNQQMFRLYLQEN